MCVPPENEAGGQEAGNCCKVILSVWWHYLPLTFFSYIILINVQKIYAAKHLGDYMYSSVVG